MKWGGQFEQEKKDRAGSSYSHSDRNGDILVYSKGQKIRQDDICYCK